mmetsp:Transcript_9089/g.30290  ORF Transcript_9089/g.30290 Transcript_9089/m.30290 type:complete len:451 (-) Transcript_9089:63-1415(-)
MRKNLGSHGFLAVLLLCFFAVGIVQAEKENSAASNYEESGGIDIPKLPDEAESTWVPDFDDLDMDAVMQETENSPAESKFQDVEPIREQPAPSSNSSEIVALSSNKSKAILEELSTADQQIVEILREMRESGQNMDMKVWRKLKREGVRVAHMKEAGLANEFGVLTDPTRSKESEKIGRTFKGVDGSLLLKDSLGRFPAWTRQGVHSSQRIDTNPLALVTVRDGTLVDAQGGERKVTLYNPLYGMPNVSFDVVVPEEVIERHRNVSKCIMTAGGIIYRDRVLEEWPDNDFRLFIGDLGQHATDQSLTSVLRDWKGFNMARVVVDRTTGRCKGYGFASFSSAEHGVALIRHQWRSEDKICLSGRPLVIKKSTWQKKILRPEKMPEVERLRKFRHQLMSEGYLPPEPESYNNKHMKRVYDSMGIQKDELQWQLDLFARKGLKFKPDKKLRST